MIDFYFSQHISSFTIQLTDISPTPLIALCSVLLLLFQSYSPSHNKKWSPMRITLNFKQNILRKTKEGRICLVEKSPWLGSVIFSDDDVSQNEWLHWPWTWDVQRSSGPARIIIININPSSHLTGSMSRTSHLSPHHLKMGNVDKLVVLQQWHVVMLEETHCDESQHLDSERARHTWGVRPGSSTMFIRRPSVDQDGVHRQHFVWLLRWRPAPTSPGLAEKQREWKLNVVFLISISELWLRCRYFSIPRGLHNYRAEGKNI